MRIGTLRVGIEVDTKKLKSGLAEAGKQTRQGINQLGKAFLAFAAVSGVALIKVVNKASELQETTSKFNTVFRGQQTIAEDWARTLVKSYGVSTEQSKRFLASIQDLLVPMGMARGQAGKLSNEVVKLAIDLGSFNNMPTEKVMLDIQSALVGNFETMKKYGVVLNATLTEQEIMNQGWVKSKKEITTSMKAQAAYNLIVKGSTDALGDFARTSSGYANQQKILKAGLDDLMTKLGDAFLPVMIQLVNLINTQFLPIINEWIDEFTSSGEATQMFGDILKGIIQIITGVIAAFDLAGQAAAIFALAISGNFKAAKLGYEELKTKMDGYAAKFKAISNFEIAEMELKETTKSETLQRELIRREQLEMAAADKKKELQDAIDAAEDTRQEVVKSKFDEFMEGIATSMERGLTQMMDGSVSFSEGLKRIWGDMASYIIGQIAKLIATELAGSLKAVAAYLYKAAAAVWSWAASIPFVGPAIAAAVIAKGVRMVKKHKFQQGVRDFAGGLAVVGEGGPELVRLPRGSDVFTNRETREIIREGGEGGDVFNISINANVRGDEDWDRIVRNTIIPSLNRYKRKTSASPFL